MLFHSSKQQQSCPLGMAVKIWKAAFVSISTVALDTRISGHTATNLRTKENVPAILHQDCVGSNKKAAPIESPLFHTIGVATL